MNYKLPVAKSKKIKNVMIAFQIMPNNEKAPNGYQFFNFHVVFEINVEDFYGKALLVAGGHVTYLLELLNTPVWSLERLYTWP